MKKTPKELIAKALEVITECNKDTDTRPVYITILYNYRQVKR